MCCDCRHECDVYYTQLSKSVIKIIIVIIIICVNVLPACAYVQHTHTWCLRRLEECVDPLERELRVIVSHVDAGTQAWVFYKCSECSKSMLHLSSPLAK